MRTRIKDLREDNDFYQKEIAKILSISQAQYSRIESEENQLSYDGLEKLAKLYNTSVDYILRLTDNKKPYPKGKSTNNE